MSSFRHFFLLSLIAISLGEEVPPQALASKETQLEPAAKAALPQATDGTKAGLDAIMEPKASQVKIAEKPVTGDTHAQDAAKDAPALGAPRSPPASEGMASAPKEDEALPDPSASEEMASAPKEDEDGGAMEVMHMTHMAALLSFVGVACYSFVFLCKIFKLPSKDKSQGSPPSTNRQPDELDFEDLEGAQSVALATPLSRKSCSSTQSDDGWGGDNAWGNDNWDDLDDCEADLDTMDSAISSGALPAAPPPVKLAPVKGKKGKGD